MGLFDDLTAPPPAQRRAPGMFDDLAAPQRAAPPPLLQRAPARPTPLKRAAVNAEAAFYGADGDTAGLGSEALIWTAAGRDRRQAAVGNRGLANLLGSVGLDSVAGYLNSTANEQDAEAAAKAAAFERAQQQRRQAVANLGPAQGFGEKAADLGGRLSASIPQPENFVGGPVLKGASLGAKVVRAGTGAALANIATEPVLQASAVGRGTRDELSLEDAAVNTAVAFGTGGLFGAGAHGIEKLRGRGTPAEAPPASGGMFDDLAGASPEVGGPAPLAPSMPLRAQTVSRGAQAGDGTMRTAVLRQPRTPRVPLADVSRLGAGGDDLEQVTRRDFLRNGVVGGALTAADRGAAAPRPRATEQFILDRATKDAVDLGEVLPMLARETDNPAYRDLANRLSGVVPGIKLRALRDGYNDHPVPAPGALNSALGVTRWDKAGNVEVWLRDKGGDGRGPQADTVLHEALHAATMRQYGLLMVRAAKNPPELLQLSGYRLESIPRNGDVHIDRIKSLWDEAGQAYKAGTPNLTARDKFNIEAALSNPDELIAWGMTDPGVQRFLKGARGPVEGKSLWDEFVAWVRDLLGLDPSPETGTLLADLMSTTNRLIDTIPTEAAPPRQGVVGYSAQQRIPSDSPRRPVLRGDATSRDQFGRPLSTVRPMRADPDGPPFAPNSPPPVPPSDGGIFADLRGLATEDALKQTLGDLVKPEDVTPLRGPRPRVGDNRVSSLAEADRANPPTAERLTAPDERDAFPTRRLASRSDPRRAQFRKEPMDLVTQVRRWGGLKEYGGELSHLGIDNKPRAMEFARNEHFLGKLVDNDKGLDLDDAAQRAWEEGYFPDLSERPDVETFMLALASTHRGDNRVFHPNDWEALADYRSRLGDRMRIEQSGREGAPASVIRGEPVTPDDLDARALPVEAYQADLPARELAGNIRTDLLDSPQSIDRALREVAAKAGGFREARRGIQRQEQTRELAAELGMTVEQLLKRRPGQALNAEQALAARQILAKSGNELVALAKRSRGGTDEDLAAFRTALLRHASIQEQVSGATAEAGRALSQFRMTANSRDVMGGPVIRGDVVRSIIDGAGGREHLEDVAQKLLEQGSDPAKINKVAQAAAKPGGREKFMELYINSLLSGPQTHAVNILSNAITAIGQVPETLGAAAIGGVRRALGSTDPDRVLFSEAGARAVGLVQGAREGLRLGVRAFKTGEPSDMVGAIENSQYRAISGGKGELIRIPTRALTAEDEFFKAIARRMELNAVAVRKAGAMGLKGQARRDKVAELVANPTDEMFEQSKEYARYLTFQRKLGPLGQRMLATTNTPTAGGAVWKWLFPFLRTPINLVKFAAERSPLAPAMKEWRTDYAAGGARRDIALARLTFGTGVAAMIGTWAAEGTITGGGPADAEERALLLADGWRPYSVRLGGKFYSYDRLDPLATVIGTVADLVDRANDSKEADAAEVGTAVIASILSNLGGGIFLDTMGDLAQAVDRPSMADKFIASQAGKLVPAIVGQASQVADPVIREAKAPLDRIKSRIPGLSSGLLPKRDIWGQPIKRPGRLGPDLASPLPVGKALNDPINRELMRLGVQIGRAQRKIGGVELNAVEYDAYQETAGKLARQYIQEEIQGDWKRMPAADQIEAVKAAVKDARADARDKLRERFPHLQEADED